MNSASESVVIEDDDDDVEIVDEVCSGNGNNQSVISEGLGKTLMDLVEAPKKLIHVTETSSGKKWPQEINGFTKPSYNYCRLITQALATAPERRATAVQVCEMIAKKHPYYAHLTDLNWQGSIYSALRTRKKFFTIVGTNEKNEIVWSFNPTFEQYMLDKWVPKYVGKNSVPPGLQKNHIASLQQKNSITSTMQGYVPWLSKGSPQQPTVLSESSVVVTSASPVTAPSASPSPVIVFAGSLVTASPSNTSLVVRPGTSGDSNKDPLGPEIGSSQVEDDCKPWEPEVTVNEDTPNYKTQPPDTLLAIALQGGTRADLMAQVPTYRKSYNDDFSLDNLNIKHVILREEIAYRVNFNKEHQSVEKFRLHCTVCDDHLGTSGSACHRKVRFHAVLGVLVCAKCYSNTCNTSTAACLWCSKPLVSEVCVGCVSCTNMMCQTCLKRNFGQSWCSTTINQGNWKCFQCDTKQIWPHRAIAYFLFRHYRDIKKKKDLLSTNKQVTLKALRFFIQDLSTCCRNLVARESQPMTTQAPKASVGPAVVTSATPSVTSQPVFVVGEQSPNYIYLQTPSSVPSVTLNTGTQYIHNVYPDKNYVVLDQSVESRPVSSVNTSTLANTVLYTQPLSTTPSFPATVLRQPAENNLSYGPVNKLPPYTFPKSPPPPYSVVNLEGPPVQNVATETVEKSTSNILFGSKQQTEDQTASKVVGSNDCNIIITSTSTIHCIEPEEAIIIPDDNPPEEVKIQEEKVIAVPLLSARERIERRPMPKSKKQSLLRTVLMNESIESMKRHLQLQPEPNISADNTERPVSSTSSELRQDSNQNMEEPILKSIIETATERLLSIQKNQNVISNSGYNNEETRSAVATVNSPSEDCIDLCDSVHSSTQAKVIEPPVTVPKIKIKTLKELQDPEVFKVDCSSQESSNVRANEEVVDEESVNNNQMGNQELNKENVTDETEINITGLKQGIIEASRTLINTQKQFKELAKVISSNLVYKSDQAVELITKFHDILKTCHQELDQIDGNVKREFEHLIPNTAVDSILQAISKTKEATPNAGPVVLRKKKKKRKSRHSKGKSDDATLQNVEQNMDLEETQTDSLINHAETDKTNIHTSIKRKRDLVDFNPLGKKIILGSPDVTEEDLRRIPDMWNSSSQGGLNQNNAPSHNQVYMDELRRRQYLSRKDAWKRKNIWLNTRRKKRKDRKRLIQQNVQRPLMYNEEGSLIKKRPYKRRKKIHQSDDDDEDVDKTYRPNNNQYHIRRRSRELSTPLRLSARRHPSTVALVAQLTSCEQRDITDIIKPCSVVLDRIDPKMIQILVRSVVNADPMDLSRRETDIIPESDLIPRRCVMSLSDSDAMESGVESEGS